MKKSAQEIRHNLIYTKLDDKEVIRDLSSLTDITATQFKGMSTLDNVLFQKSRKLINPTANQHTMSIADIVLTFGTQEDVKRMFLDIFPDIVAASSGRASLPNRARGHHEIKAIAQAAKGLSYAGDNALNTVLDMIDCAIGAFKEVANPVKDTTAETKKALEALENPQLSILEKCYAIGIAEILVEALGQIAAPKLGEAICKIIGPKFLENCSDQTLKNKVLEVTIKCNAYTSQNMSLSPLQLIKGMWPAEIGDDKATPNFAKIKELNPQKEVREYLMNNLDATNFILEKRKAMLTHTYNVSVAHGTDLSEALDSLNIILPEPKQDNGNNKDKQNEASTTFTLQDCTDLIKLIQLDQDVNNDSKKSLYSSKYITKATRMLSQQSPSAFNKAGRRQLIEEVLKHDFQVIIASLNHGKEAPSYTLADLKALNNLKKAYKELSKYLKQIKEDAERAQQTHLKIEEKRCKSNDTDFDKAGCLASYDNGEYKNVLEQMKQIEASFGMYQQFVDSSWRIMLSKTSIGVGTVAADIAIIYLLLEVLEAGSAAANLSIAFGGAGVFTALVVFASYQAFSYFENKQAAEQVKTLESAV